MKLVLQENKQFLQIVDCTQHEYDQLKLSFTKKIDGWRWHPLVKKGVWNGEICFIKHNKVPAGLWQELREWASKYKFDLQIKGVEKLFYKGSIKDDFIKWQEEFFKDHELTPRDYQIDAAVKILKYRRCLAELATSAGKSLIMFMILGYLLDKKLAKRILLIVPNVSLVLQASEDFDDYNNDKLKIKIQQIYAGAKIKDKTNVVIGTYHSLTKKKEPYYKNFDAVIVDETHKGNSNSIRNILDKCWHCDYRFGLSGTVPKKGTIDRLSLMSNTGPLITEVNADYLIKKGHITPCEVKIINMKYAKQEEKEAFYGLSKTPEDRKKLFSLEQNYIAQNKKRLAFVSSFINKSTKNSLALFHRIEHGKELYNKLRNIRNKEVYYVDGGTDKEVREDYKAKMETGEGKILVASFGTFSTGISIKNIHNVFLTESFKSEVIIRQSIGRGLRKHSSKNKLLIIDFVDDLRYKYEDYKGSHKTFKNYLYKHGESRREIYKEQNFPYEIKNVTF
jgi:superfamily II DNA or RNA helicase